MFYLVPGLLAGIAFYLFLAAVNWVIKKLWLEGFRLRAYSRLVVHCLVAIAFTIYLVVAGGGGNWATHLQVSGFLLAGCLLSFITAAQEKSDAGKIEEMN